MRIIRLYIDPSGHKYFNNKNLISTILDVTGNSSKKSSSSSKKEIGSNKTSNSSSKPGSTTSISVDSYKSGNASFIASDIAKSQEGRAATEAEIESWRSSVEEHSNLSPKKSSDVVESKSSNNNISSSININDSANKSDYDDSTELLGYYIDNEFHSDFDNLVTADQLTKFGWSDTSVQFVKKLNDVLTKYGITDIKSIRLLMATMAAESGWGKDPLEHYSAKKNYGKNERGAGYIQITWRNTHLEFLKTMNDSFLGADTATYIANNYALEAAAWYWRYELKTSAGNLNAYVAINGDGLNIFLASQYFVNAFPTQNKNPIPGFDTDLASIRKGGSYTINKDKNGNSVSLSVNGNTYDLPNNWDDREDAYNKAIMAFK